MRLALDATPNKVPAVSNKLTKRKDMITLIIAISNAPIMSSFNNIGESFGGADTIPLN